jgi:hypothetical protein
MERVYGRRTDTGNINENIENLIQSLATLITNTSEFLMKNAGLLGIRTDDSISKEYSVGENMGVFQLKSYLQQPPTDAFGMSTFDEKKENILLLYIDINNIVNLPTNFHLYTIY